MTAMLRLPKVLAEAANTDLSHRVGGSDVAAALQDLFRQEPGLKHHVVDEDGAVRRHVLVFVDGLQARLETPVGENADIQVVQAVSGGGGPQNRP